MKQKMNESSGADPIQNSSVEFDSKQEYWPIREAVSGHGTDLIDRFQRRVKIYTEILIIGSVL